MGKNEVGGLSREDWDRLLDGEPHDVDMSLLRLPGGIAGFRSAVYREAEKRFGRAKTQRTDVFIMRVQGFDCRPELRARIANQGGRPNAYPRQDYSTLQRPVRPAPQDQPPSDTEPLIEEDTEALLGPCTCGQDPTCLPSCERFS